MFERDRRFEEKLMRAPIVAWLESGSRMAVMLWERRDILERESAWFVSMLMNRRRRVTALVPGWKVSWKHPQLHHEITVFFNTSRRPESLRGRHFDTVWSEDYAARPRDRERRQHEFREILRLANQPLRVGFGEDVLEPIHEVQFLPGCEPEAPALPPGPSATLRFPDGSEVTVRSAQTKAERAEPISTQFQAGRVRYEPLYYWVDEYSSSADRIDAMLFACQHLVPKTRVRSSPDQVDLPSPSDPLWSDLALPAAQAADYEAAAQD